MTPIGLPRRTRTLLAVIAGSVALAGCGAGGTSLQAAATMPPAGTTGASAAPASGATPTGSPSGTRGSHTRPAKRAHRGTSLHGSKHTGAGAKPGTTPRSKPGTKPSSRPGTKPTSRPASKPKSKPTTAPKAVPAARGMSADEAQVLTLVNKERASAGCGALSANTLLVTVARAHSKDMAVQGYFDHTSKDGRSPFDRMRAAGYKGNLMGENIAAGQSTPAAVMDAWMHSPGHRANILNCGYKVIGIGVYRLAGSPYRVYWTQDFGDR